MKQLLKYKIEILFSIIWCVIPKMWYCDTHKPNTTKQRTYYEIAFNYCETFWLTAPLYVTEVLQWNKDHCHNKWKTNKESSQLNNIWTQQMPTLLVNKSWYLSLIYWKMLLWMFRDAMWLAASICYLHRARVVPICVWNSCPIQSCSLRIISSKADWLCFPTQQVQSQHQRLSRD